VLNIINPKIKKAIVTRIAMLILRYLQIKSTFNWSLSNLVAILRMNLFTYRDLWAWINEPFDTPPILYVQEQMELAFA